MFYLESVSYCFGWLDNKIELASECILLQAERTQRLFFIFERRDGFFWVCKVVMSCLRQSKGNERNK